MVSVSTDNGRTTSYLSYITFSCVVSFREAYLYLTLIEEKKIENNRCKTGEKRSVLSEYGVPVEYFDRFSVFLPSAP